MIAEDCLSGCVGGEMQRVVQERFQDLTELVADPRCVDRDHEADAVVAGSEVHRVVEAIDDADALPHDVGQAGHVDVVQLAVRVAGLHQGDVAVFFRVVGMIGEVAGGCEPFEQLPHDGLGGIVVGELVRSDRDMNVFMAVFLQSWFDGIDAAGMGRGRKRPSNKIPAVAQ